MTSQNNRIPVLCIISKPSVNSNWSYSLETLNSGQIGEFLVPSELEIWRMTSKNKRAPFLCYLKLCTSFHSHWWIQTGVTVRKRPNWGQICFDLCDIDLWPLNLIRWQEHCGKGVRDGRMDRQTARRTDRSVLRDAWSQLKINRLRGSHHNRKRQGFKDMLSHLVLV